jgi:hypothetical protein
VRRIALSEPLDRQIERRHSAADFGDAGLDDRTTHELLREIRRTCGEGRRRLSKLRCHLISIGLGDESTRLLSVDLDGDVSTAEDFDARNAAGRLQEACQDQSLVGRADLALVLLVDLGRRPTLGHSQFRHAAILAGAICADLYAIAADLEIGTTTIGGIDSTLLVELLGLSPTHFPLCIQLFGSERDDPVKLDATDHRATNRRLRSATGRDPSRAPNRRR